LIKVNFLTNDLIYTRSVMDRNKKHHKDLSVEKDSNQLKQGKKCSYDEHERGKSKERHEKHHKNDGCWDCDDKGW
jgi:hypothetical protein